MKDVLKSYIETIIPPIYNDGWLRMGAHTLAFGYPEQSLFWHSVNAALIGLNLLDYFQRHENFVRVDPRKLALFLTFHDIDKSLTNVPDQKHVTQEDVSQLFDSLQLDYAAFCPDLTIEQLTWLIRNHHFFSRGNAFDGKYVADAEMQLVLRFAYVADGLSTMTNPSKTFNDPEKSSDRTVNTVFEGWFKGYTLGYHRINYISGYATNLLHTCIAELLAETDKRIEPLCFFPDGCLYIMPTESVNVAKSVTLEMVVERFLGKFQSVLSQTGQVIAFRKNVPSRIVPAGFAFLLEPCQILDSARDEVLRWREKDLAVTTSIEDRHTPLIKRLDKQKVDSKQVPRDKSLIDFRAVFSYIAFVKKLLDAYYDNSREEATSEANDTTDKPSQRTRRKQAEPRKVDRRMAELVGLDVQAFLESKGKTEDADSVGIVGAVHLCTRSQTLPQDAPLDKVSAAMTRQARSTEDFIRELNVQAKTLFNDVGTREKLQALAANEIINKQDIEKFMAVLANGQPVSQVLANDLANILREYFSLMGQQLSPGVSLAEAKCSTCGRRCNGIELTATITAGGAVKTYSNANMAESIDSKPRQVCALCFCENVLRRVLAGQGKNPIYLFAFPEYVFTPYHAQFFESDIANHLFVEERQVIGTKSQETDGDSDHESEGDEEETELPGVKQESALLDSVTQFILVKGHSKQREFRQLLNVVTPVLVVPYEKSGKNVSELETWTQLFQQVLQLRGKLGLKYLLADNFYPEVFGLDEVQGSIQLQGVHPTLLRRLRKWITGLRLDKKERIRRLPVTTLTLEESNRVEELMKMVGSLSLEAATDEKQKGGKSKIDWKKEKRLRLEFISSTAIFPAADLYQSKRRK